MTAPQNAVELLLQFIETDQRFLQSPEAQNLKTVRQLVEDRRRLLDSLPRFAKGEGIQYHRDEQIDSLLNRCRRLDGEVEAAVKELQNNLTESINHMRKTRKSFRGYKTKKKSEPRFIDKKR